MAFKLTTRINVQVNGEQLTAAATKIRQKLQGVTVKVAIEPTAGSLGKLRPAITKKLGSASFPFKVHVTDKSLRVVRKDIQKAVSDVKAVVDISVNSKALGQVTQISRAVKNTGAQAKVAGNLLEKLGKDAALALRRFGAFTVTTSLVFGLVIAIKQAVSEAIDFERQIIKVSQVTGKSVAKLSGLKQEITSLSTEFGVSSIQLAETARILSQTGLSARDVTIALRTLAKTQLAPTFGDLNKTTEASIAIMRQFGGTASDLEAQLSAVNAVAGKFAVESDDIAVAVRRTGGAFKAAGGNLNELIALFTSVRSTTRESAESIATGFRTIFTRLQRTRTQSFLSKLGIQLRDSEGQFVGPLKAIERLSLALNKIDSTDPRFAAILEELGGFRQISKAIPLIQQFATTRAALNVIEKEGSTLDRDAAKAQETLSVRISQTKQEFVALIREISETTAFRGFVEISLQLASALIKIASAIKPLIPLIGVFATVTLGRSIGPIAKGFIPGIKGASSKNDGGLIPGRGPNIDSVAAVLTKGEFVLQRSAVDKIGLDNLRLLNAGKFNRGGPIGFNHGGPPGNLPAGSATILPGGPTEIAKLLSAQFAKDTANQVAKASKITKADILKGVPLSGRGRTPIVAPTPNALVSGFTGSSTTGPPTLRSSVPVIPQPPRAGARAAQSLAGRASAAGAGSNLSQLAAGAGGGGFNLNNFLLLSTIAGGLATTFSTLDENASSTEKVMVKLLEGFTSVASQLFLFSTILNNINLQKGLDSLGGFVGKLKGISLSGFGAGGIKGSAGRIAGGVRGAFSGGISGSFKNSAAGQLRSGKLTGAGAKSALLKAGAIAIIGNAVGGSVKSSGLEEIVASGTGQGKVQVGGAISGAATGAALGSVFGPIGIAAGAAAGGLIGFLNATKEAEEALKDFNRGNFRQNLTEAQQTVSAGKALTPGQQAKLDKQLAGAGTNAALASGVRDGRVLDTFGVSDDASLFDRFLSSGAQLGGNLFEPTSEFGQKTQNQKDIDQASLDLGKDAKDQIANIKLQVQSGKQFKQVLDDNQISLSQFAAISRAAGEDVGFLQTALEDVNKGQKETSAILKAMAVAAAAAFVVFKNMQTLAGNVRRATSAVATFDARLAALRGEVVVGDSSALFEGAAQGNLSQGESKLLRSLVLEIGSRTGKAGEEIAKGAVAEAALASVLPTLIKDLVIINDKDFDDKETRVDLLKGAITDSLTAELKPVFGKDAGALAKTKAEKFVAGLTTSEDDPTKIAELTDIKSLGALQDRQRADATNLAQVADSAKLLAANFRQLVGLTKERIEGERKLATILNRSVDLRANRDRVLQQSRNPNGSVPLSRRLGGTSQQLNNILGGAGGLGGGSSVGQISSALQQAERDQITLNEQAEGSKINGAAIKAAAEQTGVVKKLSSALEFLAANTKDAANIQSDLNKEQAARKRNLDRATIEAFGTFEQREGLKQDDRSLALAQRFGTKNLSDETRQQALSAINRLGPEQRKRQLKNLIDGSGFGGAGITSAGAAESALDTKLEVALNRQIEASDKIAENQKKIVEQLAIDTAGRARNFDLELDSNKQFVDQQKITKELLKNIKTQLIGGIPVDRNAGGFIPGVGNSDSVNARLTPGEFVIRKESARVLGPQFLNEMNNASRKSTKSVGAGVRFQEGGSVVGVGSSGEVNLQGVATFNIAVSNFVSGVNTLSASLDAFPREITGNFRHSVEVIFNGAEIMTRLMPEIREIALNSAKSELRKFVAEKLPDIGPLN